MIQIEDLFSEIVDSIRSVGNITFYDSITSIITVDDVTDLKVGDFIKILADADVENVKITNILGFDITISTSSSIINPASYKANAPYYDFEKWTGAANELLLKDDSPLYRNQKYPLIFMLLDIEEEKDSDRQTFTIARNLNFIIATGTSKTDESTWRLENIFKLILNRLYEKFIAAIKSNEYIRDYITIDNRLPHTCTKRYFLGTSDANQNKFNDFVDAIELNINELRYETGNICVT